MGRGLSLYTLYTLYSSISQWETVYILPPANRILSFLQLANRRRPIVTPADRRLPFVPLANGRRLYENLIWYQSGTIYLKIVIYELLGIFLMFLLWFKYIYKLYFTSRWTHKMECKIPEKGNHVNKVCIQNDISDDPFVSVQTRMLETDNSVWSLAVSISISV